MRITCLLLKIIFRAPDKRGKKLKTKTLADKVQKAPAEITPILRGLSEAGLIKWSRTPEQDRPGRPYKGPRIGWQPNEELDA